MPKWKDMQFNRNHLTYLNNPAIVLIFTIAVSMNFGMSHAEPSKTYNIDHICGTVYQKNLYRKVEGVLLISKNERNLDCLITFQTNSILQRFMLRFEKLKLDCNDHLYVFDGAHTNSGAHKVDISCKNTKETMGFIFTNTNFVTLQYTTDGFGTSDSGFQLIVTAIKDSKHSCSFFKCSVKDICIHSDLVCDSIDNCGYGEDESNSLQCKSSNEQARELTVGYIVAPFLLLVLLICIIAIILCFCRRIVKQHNSKNQNFPTLETKNPNYYHPVINKLSSNFTKNNCNEPILDVDYSKTMNHKDEWFV